jgi:transcriptional regulator with GAF, ATPase, and Fis domain
MAKLLAIAGPLKGAVFQLVSEEVTIGRLASCHLCVGDLSVSRQHCAIQPADGAFRIRDLGSNNGTFINGKRVEEAILADGDEIRVGDTIFLYVEKHRGDDQELALPDNGLSVNSCIEQTAWQSAETAIRTILDSRSQDQGFTTQARTLLKIGAQLNTWQPPELLEAELLKQILEVVPADRAATVLIAPGTGEESNITGVAREHAGPSPVTVSRTLVTRVINSRNAIFSDDINSSAELAKLSSLTGRCVDSVIVVPLIVDGKPIGAIYLESANPANPLRQDHLEFMMTVAEFAATPLGRARHLKILQEENHRLHGVFRAAYNLVGLSACIRQVSERIAKIARTDATVMIRGETGSGKELAARAIHQSSARAGRPFEAINCSLLRDTLLESELFGHERGSFTGAVAQKKGKLELAEGGTLFLDEVAELGESPQAMLLRVLQTREFQRLGGTRALHADIRIIAATNKNLEDAVEKKSFREDLYYRLNVVSLTMPPLRERREDIPLLASHFLETLSRKNKRAVRSISPEAGALLMRYHWPGNVRQLENAIEHAVVFGSTDEILPEDLPEVLLSGQGEESKPQFEYHHAVREAKRTIVLSAMQRASGNLTEAARLLGLHVNNLHRLIRELELKPLITASLQQR